MQKKRKYVKRRHNFAAKLGTFLFGPFFKRKVGYEAARIKLTKLDKPYLLVSNHVQWLDPILLTMTFGEQIYYVATEHMFNGSLSSRLIKFFFNPIPKSKNKIDIAALRQVFEVINEGGNVGIFIEGNSTMNGKASNIPIGIGKLALKLKVPIVLFTFDYSYLKHPRWAKSMRNGKFSGEIKDVLYYEDYQKMNHAQLSNYIESRIALNVYDLKPRPFPGKNKAEGLEKVIFQCPNCQQNERLLAYNDTYFCPACGFAMIYDNFGYLHSSFWPHYKSLPEIDEQNKAEFQDALVQATTFERNAVANVSYLYKRKRTKKGKAEVKVTLEAITLTFIKSDEQITYPLSEIDHATIAQKETVLIYLKNEQTIILSLTPTTKTFAYELVVGLQVILNIYKYKANNERVNKLDPAELGL